MPNYSKKIVYLSKEQYQELITNNSVTVNGVTVNYNENDIYVTPQAEPITDIKINNISIGSNGVANIPIAGDSLGVVKVESGYGIAKNSAGRIYISGASDSVIKTGEDSFSAIVPARQEKAVFYGLAKAAGDSTQSASSNAVGTYTDSAKQKIQNMLGITSLFSTEESSTATAAHAANSLFMMDGKLNRATTAIAMGDAVEIGTNCEVVKADEVFVKNTDNYVKNIIKSNGDSVLVNGIFKISTAFTMSGYNELVLAAPTTTVLKAGTATSWAVTPSKQHEAIFFGLSKLAGIDLANETVTVGTYPETSKTAIRSLIGAAAISDIPTLTNLIDDTAGNGTTNKVWSADKVYDQLDLKAPKANPVFTGSVSLGRKAETTVGINSLVIGADSVASGTASIALGYKTTANSLGQFVFGQLNVEDPTEYSNYPTYLEIVGNGTEEFDAETSDSRYNYSNARTLDMNGNERLNGYLYVGCNADSSGGVRVPHDIQINNTSIVSNGVANIPLASTSNVGAVQIGYGLTVSNNKLYTQSATNTQIKEATASYAIIAPYNQHTSVFYGLAKAAGDTTQSSSENAVGTYTSGAKTAIQTMLGAQAAIEVIRL